MESILEFMYLGATTFCQERMNEFLNVAERFILNSHKAMFKTLDDVWFWCKILMLDFDTWGGVQNTSFKISEKLCLRLLMMLDFDAWFWHLILTLDFETDERTTLTLELLRNWKPTL